MKKNTKSALLLSVVSIIVCCTMLLGTTMAWFTDSVTSAKNVIVAGNLDVELYHEGTKVDENYNIFEDISLWEPGVVYYETLTIKNEGNLALKYDLSLNWGDYNTVGGKNLSDVLSAAITTEAIASREDAMNLDFAPIADVAIQGEIDTTKGEVEDTVTLVLYWEPSDNDNDYNVNNGKETSDKKPLWINLGINLFATQLTAESDSFDNQYDLGAAIFVTSAAEAQAALDNAKKGDVIVLTSGVDYGTLLLRPVDGNANTTTSLNEGDGEGLTVYRNEYIRTVEDLTILGTTNAKVDAIKVESGYIADGSSSCNLVVVKGLVIDSVEFTDKADCAPHTYSAPIFFNLTWTDVDGLTVKNCKLIGNDDKVNFVYFTIDSSSAFDGIASNVTLTGNTVDGIARLCELRQTENVTITDNTIKNTALHGILLTVHGKSYAGDVTITGNTAYGINDRFVRMAGAGDANVVIKDNTIIAYLGEDADYIKVTDSTGTPVIENNTLVSVGVKNAAELQAALDSATDGDTIVLMPNVNYGVVYLGRPTASNDTIMTCNDGTNHSNTPYTTTKAEEFKTHLADGKWHTTPRYTTTLKNLTIIGAEGATIEGLLATSGHAYGDVYDYVLDKDYDVGSAYYNTLNINNVEFKNVNFTGTVNINTSDATSVYDGVTFDGCTFTTGGTASTNGPAIRYYNEANNGNVKNIVVKGCTFTNCYQGVYVQHVNGVTVTGCTFDTTGHNAIALQGHDGAVDLKKVVITGNTFKNIGDRVIRFNNVGSDSNITIQGNTATNSGDDDGEVMKATSIAEGVTTSISGNTWNGTVVNEELKDET